MPRYKIADVVFDAETKYEYTSKLCHDYLYFGKELPAFSVVINDSDVEYEKALCKKQDDLPEFTDAYLESVSLFRKFSEYIFENANGIIFHCSALSVNGKGVLFTGKSGAGKSTHARLWREAFSDSVISVNDDKPVVRKIDGKFYVFGTPWTGKHQIGANVKAEVKAICGIIKDKDNSVSEMSNIEALSVILNQTIRPESESGINKLIDFAQDFLSAVKAVNIKCNVSIDAAKTAYGYIFKGEDYAN